jgi:hypothetical protein
LLTLMPPVALASNSGRGLLTTTAMKVLASRPVWDWPVISGDNYVF